MTTAAHLKETAMTTSSTLIPAGTRVWINQDGNRVQAIVTAACSAGGYFVSIGGARETRIAGDQIVSHA